MALTPLPALGYREYRHDINQPFTGNTDMTGASPLPGIQTRQEPALYWEYRHDRSQPSTGNTDMTGASPLPGIQT